MREPAAAHGGVALGGAAIPIMVVLGGLAILPCPALASPSVQTFGPGKVSCQPLAGTQVDCLLAASRITDDRNVTTFDVSLLPRRDQALFRKWCLAGTDSCIVTVTGRRMSPQSTRLSAVTSVHWTRLSEPENDAAARGADKASSTDTTGAAIRPAQ